MSIKFSRKLIFFVLTSIIIISLLFTTIFIVLFSVDNKNAKTSTNINMSTTLSDDEINTIISKMTLEEKIGQMFIVSPETFSDSPVVTSYSDINAELVKKYNVGGFIMSSKNVVTPTQITDLNEKLKLLDETLFICITEEGGEIATIGNTKSFPVQKFENMRQIGTEGNQQKAITVGNSIGEYLYEFGFNVNFAPNCDIFLFSNKNMIKKQSFGASPKVVMKMSEGILEGLHNNGILATAKHFPGYGNVSDDTFAGSPISYTTKVQFNDKESLPFKNMIKKDVDFIMTSNAIYPNLSDTDLPASLNKDIVNILKNELDYNGIIITDSLNNGTILNKLQKNDDLILPFVAGNDIALMPSDFFKSYDALLKAVKKGEISEEKINYSVFKILKAKSKIS